MSNKSESELVDEDYDTPEEPEEIQEHEDEQLKVEKIRLGRPIMFRMDNRGRPKRSCNVLNILQLNEIRCGRLPTKLAIVSMLYIGWLPWTQNMSCWLQIVHG